MLSRRCLSAALKHRTMVWLSGNAQLDEWHERDAWPTLSEQEAALKVLHLLDDIKFDDLNAHAEPLHVDKLGRVIVFSLRPGQVVQEHAAPSSPVYIVVLKGRGLFSGGSGVEQQLHANDMVLFNPGEQHAIRAVDEDLIFLLLLHGSPWSD
jgi:quercetin dioxygenase-like cupin family protein